MFPNTYFPSGSGTLYVDGTQLKYRHLDGKVLTLLTVTSPVDIAGLQLWLKADEVNGASEGTVVAAWPDASGRGRDASQPLVARRPIYKTGLRNGLPALRFDGVDDCLDGASANWRTVFAVTQTSTSPTAHQTLWGHSERVDMSIRRFVYGPTYSHNNGNDFAPASAIRINGVATNVVANGVWHILTAESPSLRSFPYRVAGTGLFTPGRTWAGDIAELIVYDRVLPAADLADVERYLSFKYAIPLGL